jgi:hypothetical protein
MTLMDLDTLRADLMICMLSPEARRYVGLYDIGRCRDAYHRALADQSYDDMMANADGLRANQPYVLTGPGMVDAPFGTPAELLDLVAWICQDGYLSCYLAPRFRFTPHLASTRAHIASLWAEPA